MSSLRNAVKRIAHKERSQPAGRQHLGILEKKKDYKARADDFHRKEKAVRIAREKAAMRNPDEFYFGMNSTKLQDGKHVTDTQSRDLPGQLIRLMKDQDLSYIRMQKQKDQKKLERLQSSLHFLDHEDETGTAKRRRHTVFVEDDTEAKRFNVAEHFQTVPRYSGRAHNRPRKTTDSDNADGAPSKLTSAKPDRSTLKRAVRARESAYAELKGRRERVKMLRLAETKLETEKLMQAKGRKRMVKAKKDGKPAQYKWRRIRLK